MDVKEPPQGLAPPGQEGSKKSPQAPGGGLRHRLRKFVARPSAGLRVRVHPTLQSEQIGVLPVGGVVAIADELQNADGLWVRLAPDSLAELATSEPPGRQHPEGWCLQYNQHLEKTLLVPVEEPKAAETAEVQVLTHTACREALLVYCST